MARNSDFAAFVAARWLTPVDALAEFWTEAQAAAAEVGARLDRAPTMDGRRAYLANLAGKRDQRHWVRASVHPFADGTAWPGLTFGTFSGGGRTVFYSPRESAWRLFRAEVDAGRVDAGEVDAERADAIRAVHAERLAAAQAEAERAAAADALREREAHAAAAEAARLAWEAATPAEVAGHDYMRRKRLAGDGLRVATADMRARLYSVSAERWLDRATVVRAGDLLVPMCGADGALVNLERIDARGSKRGIAGGQRVGAWYTIPGAGPDVRRTVCEGYATGAAWAEATGDTVAVAFSAGNLPTVAAAFGAQFVAADHDRKGAGERAAQKTGLPYAIPARVGDWWDVWALDGAEPLREAARIAIASAVVPAYLEPWKLAAPDLKGRSATWFNKLAKVADAEQAAALAWAIAARLSARIPCADDVGTLCDRIVATVPPEAMNPRTLAAIREGIERRIEWRKRRALSALRMSPEALRRHRVEVVEELPELRPEKYRGVILIAAPMAAGKTQRVGIPFAQWAKREGAGFLALAHRRSLIAELARRLGCDHYEQVTAQASPFVSTMATCLNSLTSEAHAGIIRRAHMVFVDEIGQVLRAIASETTVAGKRSRGEMLDALRRLVAEAECVIGADAGMCDRVLRFVESCRPGERARVIVVPARDEGLRATFGLGADALAAAYGEALARLSEGERLWIACGEVNNRARECAKLLEMHGNRVLLLTSKNRDGTAQAAFWADPESVSREYAAVVASPVVSSGLSIEHRDDGPRFDRVFWIGSGACVTPADALQQMRRVRYVRGFTVAVVPNNAQDIDDANAILQGMGDAADVAGAVNPVPAAVDEFVAEIDAADARARADFAAGLFWAMQAAGFKVERAGDAGDAGGDGDESDDAEQGVAVTAELKALRAQLREERIERILAARVIDLAEAMRLRDRPNRSEADAAALDRWFTADALGIQPADVDRQAVEDCDDFRGPRAWDRFSAAVLGVGDARMEQAELSRRRFPRARVAAYARLFEGFDLRPGTRFSPDDAAEIIRRVIRDRHLLAFLRLVPAKWGRAAEPKPSERPMRELGDILALMGLKLRRREGTATPTRGVTPLGDNGASGGGSARNRFHEIDAATWGRVASLAERRNAAKAHAADLREVGPVEAALRRVGSTARHAADIIGACLHRMYAYPGNPNPKQLESDTGLG